MVTFALIASFVKGAGQIAGTFADIQRVRTQLRKDTPRLLITHYPGSLSRTAKAHLEQLYSALETIRPVADAALKRLSRRYLGVAVALALMIVCGATLGVYSFVTNPKAVVYAAVLATSILVAGSWLAGSRARKLIRAYRGRLLMQAKWTDLKEASSSASKFVALVAPGLTSTEQSLLREYLEVATMVRSLEALSLQRVLELARSGLFESYAATMGDLMAKAIYDACRKDRLGSIRVDGPGSAVNPANKAKNSEQLQAIFAENGFSDLLLTSSGTLYENDFHSQSQEEIRRALRTLLGSVA